MSKNYDPLGELVCGFCPYCADRTEDTAWIENTQKCFCRKCHESWDAFEFPVLVLERLPSTHTPQ